MGEMFLLRKLLDYKQKKILAEVNIYPLIGSHQALPAIKFKHRGFCRRPVIRPDYQSHHCWFCQALVLSNCSCQGGISARADPGVPTAAKQAQKAKLCLVLERRSLKHSARSPPRLKESTFPLPCAPDFFPIIFNHQLPQ